MVVQKPLIFGGSRRNGESCVARLADGADGASFVCGLHAMKFGRTFASALAELTAVRSEVATWPRIDYKYHKLVLYAMIRRARGAKPPLLMRTEITGEEPMLDASADDDAYAAPPPPPLPAAHSST